MILKRLWLLPPPHNNERSGIKQQQQNDDNTTTGDETEKSVATTNNNNDNDNHTSFIFDIDNSELSTLTKGQHDRYLKLRQQKMNNPSIFHLIANI